MSLDRSNIPVRWHLAEPLDAGGLEGHIGVKPARNRLVDDSLAILLEQLDEPLPATEVADDAPVGVIEIADDGGLFGEGGGQGREDT